MRFIKVYIILLLYKCSLDFIYKYYVSNTYNYLGFEYNFSRPYYIFSLLVLVLYSFLYMKVINNKNGSSLILAILFLLYFFPNLTFNTFNGNFYFFLFSVFYAIFLTSTYFFWPRVQLIGMSNNRIRRIGFYFLLYGIVLLMIYFVVYYNGFKLKIDFENVYEIRENIQNLNYPVYINYLKPISSMFVTAGAMFYFINNMRIPAFLFLFFGLMLYAFGAHKTDFVILIMTVVIYFYYKDYFKNFLSFILLMFNVFVIIVVQFSSLEFQIGTLGMYLRAFFTPTLLGYLHYDYFISHDFLFLKEHFLHWFDSSALHTNNSPYVIANYYFGDPNMSSNTGLIGSDYAQFGWFSLFTLVLLRVFFFKIYDEVSKNLDPKILIICSLNFGFLFINGAFFTALISGGFLFMCFLFYLMPRNIHE